MSSNESAPPPCPFEKRFPSQLVRDDVFYMSLAFNQAIDAWRRDEVPIGCVIERDGEVEVFHAGTARNTAGEIVANGGRVLNVTALGANVTAAQKAAYDAVAEIDWPEGFCRRDIGWREIAREKA